MTPTAPPADQRAAFMQAIIEAPEDDTPRLIFSDWLQEQGEEDRAEFIRVQCKLPKIPQLWAEAAALRKRERELWVTLHRQFDLGIVPGSPMLLYDDECSLLVRGDRQVVRWQTIRGFVEEIACTAEDWLRHGDAIRAATPLRKVRLTTWPVIETAEEFDTRTTRIRVELSGKSVTTRIPRRELVRQPEWRAIVAVVEDVMGKQWPGIEFTLPEGQREQ